MIDGVEFTQGISTHAPLARCDIPRSMVEARWKVFQLTHLLRGATFTPPTLCLISCDFNSRTSCEVRLVAPIALVFIPISTHAPLARCDRHQLIVLWHTVFQLTHLLRGATSPRRRRMRRGSNFNSRTSCEVRPGRAAVRKLVQLHFNSRTSCEVRRLAKGLTQNQLAISTHAPLARCDGRTHLRVRYLEISTHAPLARCDGNCKIQKRMEDIFQLTHLLRGATYILCGSSRILGFQLTHLLRGATGRLNRKRLRLKFQLTHLLRGATGAGIAAKPRLPFQLTHLLRGAT